MKPPPPSLDRLKSLSRKIGLDSLLIQGAGGNTSVKSGDAMWIKASGAQLMDSEAKDIFVSVDWGRIREAVSVDPKLADQPQQFLLSGSLRPSIETCLHAVLPHKFVIHVHCVDTIALAMRVDAEKLFAAKLPNFDFAFVPYFKPGSPLAAAILGKLRPECDVFILGNHGLLIGADTVQKAEELLFDVVEKLRTFPANQFAVSEPTGELKTVPCTYDYAPRDHPLHPLAFDLQKLEISVVGGLFPDQVLFCGPKVTAIGSGKSISKALDVMRKSPHGSPVFFVLPGVGAFLSRDASETELAIARCIGDVMDRVPSDAELTYISDHECAALLNWDAEKYRRRLNT